jgi:hypothetical protein
MPLVQKKSPLIYIAGPMSGIEKFNFPAFDAARNLLTAHGWLVISPADMDREKFPGFNGDGGLPSGFNITEVIRSDLNAIDLCSCLYMLRGWQVSKGSLVEYAYANLMGKEILYESHAQHFDIIRMRNHCTFK